jgi:hypothetical protein
MNGKMDLEHLQSISIIFRNAAEKDRDHLRLKWGKD